MQFVPGPEAERKVAELALPQPFIHMHPASRWTFKCWPAERNAQLADRLAAEGHTVVLTAAPQETAFIDEILSKAASKPLNLAGRLSLKELGALTARAQLFIGVDSMPMHLAAAMGTPTVALFGPSSEDGWGASQVLQVDPFYVGKVWRDWSFARAARAAWRRAGFDLVQSHERIPGCDVYRAGDGVHRRWLELRAKAASVFERLGMALNPYHHYVCAAERRLFEHPRLRAVICNSRMVSDEIRRGFRIAPEKQITARRR